MLIDTNIILEIILAQSKSEEAKAFLVKTGEHEFFISDYSLHSIGLLLFHRKQHQVFLQFFNDMMIRGGMILTSLLVEDMEYVINAAQIFNLDFDDANQYATAEKYNLILASFDTDFDRTKRGRKTPAEILESQK